MTARLPLLVRLLGWLISREPADQLDDLKARVAALEAKLHSDPDEWDAFRRKMEAYAAERRLWATGEHPDLLALQRYDAELPRSAS